jgi:hypothetical protein
MQHYRAVFDRVVSPTGSNSSSGADNAYPAESTNQTGTTRSDAHSEAFTSDATRDRS